MTNLNRRQRRVINVRQRANRKEQKGAHKDGRVAQLRPRRVRKVNVIRGLDEILALGVWTHLQAAETKRQRCEEIGHARVGHQLCEAKDRQK